jgi:hypothetical protein
MPPDPRSRVQRLMFSEIEKLYAKLRENARSAVVDRGMQFGEVVVEGVTYDVKWGADVDEGIVGLDIVVTGKQILGRLTMADICFRPGPLDELGKAILRGRARLLDWAAGEGPFPETAEELFAVFPNTTSEE